MPILPNTHEKAFGLQPKTAKQIHHVTLRNWITFSLRNLIMKEERRAYYLSDYAKPSAEKFFIKFNNTIQEELKQKKLLFDFRGLSNKFDKIVTINRAVAVKIHEEYEWKDIM